MADPKRSLRSLLQQNGISIPGVLVSGIWTRTSGLPRLRLTGTGTVAIDARDSLGAVTTDVVGPYTLTGETNRIEFPFFGSATTEIRATITGSATAEII
jgi:hypothetical protein